MVQAIAISQIGGPEVLKVIDVSLPEPGPNEVTIKHTAIEVNYVDVYHRNGTYSLDINPKIPGVSAVGVVEKLGKDVDYLNVGDKVCYATAQGGAYSARRNISAEKAIIVNSNIPDKTLAACLVKGLTAHYLATRTFVIKPAMAVVIHSAAGGVGQILARFANMAGAYVIGTVGSDAKKEIAENAGCHIVYNRKAENWPKKILELTKGYGATAVYDGIGKDTIEGSIECLSIMGILIHYGSTSGPVNMLDTRKLAAKSLFYTRPSLFHYKKNRKELLISTADIFESITNGSLEAKIQAEMPLEKAAEAHKMLESGETSGSIILIP